MRVHAALVATVAAFLLAGCGGATHRTSATIGAGSALPSNTTSLSSAAKLPGFLATANNGAIFLQWQQQGGQVSGKLSESYFDLSNPTQLIAQANSFTGTITGSQVSITLDTGTVWSGTKNGSSMTLSYTGTDGSIQTLDFNPANAAEYNAAVASTKARVAGAVTQQQHAQAITNAQQQVDSDASAISTDMQNLQSDTGTVAGDSFSSDISTIQGDVQTVQGDLQTVKSDSSDVACNDAGVAANDAGVAANDQGVLGNDVSVDANDVQRVLDDIAKIKTDQQTFTNDNTAVPGYISPDLPAASSITSAIAQAHAAIAAEHQRVADAQAQATQLVAQARTIATQAHTVGCG